MFVIAPLLSWLIGISYGIYVGEGFAAVAVMIILFPILFIVGLIVLLIGLFKKTKSTYKNKQQLVQLDFGRVVVIE